ncbi:hypothetical protein IPN35_04055 [Candidatus Peregrinibacteria bacterium]|nr:MAG: hypothetical protein IPN35_04055 [Candidatus Peregrinibacteria bacterium]
MKLSSYLFATFLSATAIILSVSVYFSYYENDVTLSKPENIWMPSAFAGFDVNTLSIFSDYQSWTASGAPKEEDVLYLILNNLKTGYNSVYSITTQIDINGDGFTDLLYHYGNGVYSNYGVFVNKGNLSYELAYKCVYTRPSGSDPKYYGDCADPSRSEMVPLQDVFNDYLNWPTSNAPKDDDLMPQALDTLSSVYNSTNYNSIADFNGDGLTDFAYHNALTSTNQTYGVFLNKGDFTFDFAYKCVYKRDSVNNYYGDCADTASSANVPFTSIFDYTSLPESPNLKSTDTTAQTLYYMAFASNGNSGRIYNSLTDINGDGLTDVLIHYVPLYSPTSYTFGVFLNTGGLRFELDYKCIYRDIDGYGGNNEWHYFGDCAG